MVTVALGITAPELSVTVPVRVPRLVCANEFPDASSKRPSRIVGKTNTLNFTIPSLLRIVEVILPALSSAPGKADTGRSTYNLTAPPVPKGSFRQQRNCDSLGQTRRISSTAQKSGRG